MGERVNPQGFVGGLQKVIDVGGFNVRPIVRFLVECVGGADVGEAVARDSEDAALVGCLNDQGAIYRGYRVGHNDMDALGQCEFRRLCVIF